MLSSIFSCSFDRRIMRAAASFHVLRGRRAGWASRREADSELQSAWASRVRCRAGMAFTARVGEAGRGAGGERRGYVGLAHAGAVQGTCGEKLAGRGAGKSDSQEPGPLAEDLSDRGRNAARQGTGMAEYVHADQESG